MIFPLRKLSEFLNTPNEWHTFILGFCFVRQYTLWNIPQLQYAMDELHYFYFGRIIGILFWIGLTMLVMEILL